MLLQLVLLATLPAVCGLTTIWLVVRWRSAAFALACLFVIEGIVAFRPFLSRLGWSNPWTGVFESTLLATPAVAGALVYTFRPHEATPGEPAFRAWFHTEPAAAHVLLVGGVLASCICFILYYHEPCLWACGEGASASYGFLILADVLDAATWALAGYLVLREPIAEHIFPSARARVVAACALLLYPMPGFGIVIMNLGVADFTTWTGWGWVGADYALHTLVGLASLALLFRTAWVHWEESNVALSIVLACALFATLAGILRAGEGNLPVAVTFYAVYLTQTTILLTVWVTLLVPRGAPHTIPTSASALVEGGPP